MCEVCVSEQCCPSSPPLPLQKNFFTRGRHPKRCIEKIVDVDEAGKQQEGH